jgi:hypothetical protein
LLDFTQGWLYVFGVGVFGGTVLRCQADAAPGMAPEPAVPSPPLKPRS